MKHCVRLNLENGVHTKKSRCINLCIRMNPCTFRLYIPINVELSAHLVPLVTSLGTPTFKHANWCKCVQHMRFLSLYDHKRRWKKQHEETLCGMWVGDASQWDRGVKMLLFSFWSGFVWSCQRFGVRAVQCCKNRLSSESGREMCIYVWNGFAVSIATQLLHNVHGFHMFIHVRSFNERRIRLESQ